jgi:ribonuclease HI
MGIGWICPDLYEFTICSFNASITNNPSSSRAELFALISAIITCPLASFPQIFTDSQAIIQGFDQYVTHNVLTTRSREKIPNYTAWILLQHIIQQLSLTVTFVKIKGHSGDFFNDKADTLAKDGRSQPTFQLNYSSIEDLQLTFLFNNTPIEFSSRKFWKDLNSAEHFSSFIELQRNTSLLRLTRSSSVSWPPSLKNYNSQDDTPTMTTFIQRNKKAFKIRYSLKNSLLLINSLFDVQISTIIGNVLPAIMQ